jgi:salicylate hydroxylase
LLSIIHRVDYHRILLDEAIRLGAVLRLGAEVIDISTEKLTARLADGTTIRADVIIGADGI